MPRALLVAALLSLVPLPAAASRAAPVPRHASPAVQAETLSHQLVRTARHLRYRLERRAVFGGRAEHRAAHAAAALEREARRLRRAVALRPHAVGVAGGHRLTHDARLALRETGERLARVRTGHYVRGEFDEARILLRRLERICGRPGRPHLKPPHRHGPGKHVAPARWVQPASSSLVPPVFHQ